MDVIAAVAWILITGFVVYGAIHSTATNKSSDEENAARRRTEESEKREADSDEVAFVREAASLLPDSRLALGTLKGRYGWAEIVETVDLSRNHLALLRWCAACESVELPNLQRGSQGDLEWRARKSAQYAQHYEDFDVERSAQEPTTSHLRDLVRAGLVKASPPPDDYEREYSVALTERGARLRGLDLAFRDPNDGLPGAITLPRTREARQEIARIVRASLMTREAILGNSLAPH